MKICLLCNDSNIKQRFQLLFQQSFEIRYFTKEDDNYADIDAMIIVEPHIIKGEYLSVCKIWWNYFNQHYPQIKLLVAGFEKRESNNYIDLLQLNESFDLEAYLNHAFNVENTTLEDYPQNGYGSVINKLKVFFTGHNYESIIDSITKLRLLLNNAHIALYGSKTLKKSKIPFIKVWKEQLWPKRKVFQHFYSRWTYYKVFFEHLPFYKQLEKAKIHEFIDRLSWVFSKHHNTEGQGLQELEQRFKELDAFNRVGEITTLLKKINVNYINPKSFGTILLIDDDESFHKQMKMALSGFTIQSIMEIEDLKSLDKSDEFDLILLDLELDPKVGPVGGLDWINPLKEKYPDIPICVVTIHNDPTIIDYAVEDGNADFFFPKSFFNAEDWTSRIIKLITGTRYSLTEIKLYSQNNLIPDQARILLVEDEDIWAQKIMELTTEFHFDIANTVDQAVDWMKSEKFDLIIVDMYFIEEGESILKGQEVIDMAYELQKGVHVFPTAYVKKDEVVKVLDKRRIPESELLTKDQYDPIKWLRLFQRSIEFKRAKEQ